MSIASVEISESAKAFAEAKAREAGLESPGAYVEKLIDRARRREEARTRVEQLCLEGLASGPAEPFTLEDWAAMREEAMALIAARKKAR